MINQPVDVLALDIGGANLKAADGRGLAISRPFELWRELDGLSAALQALIAPCPPVQLLAVTMTGELADCFETKADGVRSLLNAVQSLHLTCAVHVYLSDGQFVEVQSAHEIPHLVAASNWHALATFCCRYLKSESGLLIDVGSTTCDLIPLTPAGPVASGRTDPERLVAGELVYTGVERSPVCAVVRSLPWRGSLCPVAQEFFATTLDAYLLLGQIEVDVDNHRTADGRPRTREAARDRLARSICADRSTFSQDDALAAAAMIHDSQVALVSSAVRQVWSRQSTIPTTIVLSGAGEFLGRHVVKRLSEVLPTLPNSISLTAEMGPKASRCAPAHALAVLARERSVR